MIAAGLVFNARPRRRARGGALLLDEEEELDELELLEEEPDEEVEPPVVPPEVPPLEDELDGMVRRWRFRGLWVER